MLQVHHEHLFYPILILSSSHSCQKLLLMNKSRQLFRRHPIAHPPLSHLVMPIKVRTVQNYLHLPNCKPSRSVSSPPDMRGSPTNPDIATFASLFIGVKPTFHSNSSPSFPLQLDHFCCTGAISSDRRQAWSIGGSTVHLYLPCKH